MVTSEAESTSLEPADVYWTSLLTWTLSCFSLPSTFNTLREFALFILKIKQQHNVLESVAGVRSMGLPSIPWTHFFHINSSQFSHQFLTASAYRLPEFGERATALQVIESILSWAGVLSSRPAGTTFPWTETGSTWSCQRFTPKTRGQELDQTQSLMFYTFYWSKLLLVCSGKNFLVKSFGLSVFSLLKITGSLRERAGKRCLRKTLSCWE